MSYILALDQGTTSCRSLLFDTQLQLQTLAQRSVDVCTPHPGWVEQDARAIWIAQMTTIQEALSQANILATDVAAIGVTNQRETTIIWRRDNGIPIAPAIVWQDRRMHTWCETQTTNGLSETVQNRTGLRIDSYFSAGKIVWLLAHIDGARALADQGLLAFGTIDSWLIWQLTRGERHVIDASNAARTMLMDLTTVSWSSELCAQWHIPCSLLPEIVPSGGLIGTTAKGLLSAEIPIYASIGDQQSALFGHDCTLPGMAKNTYGTGCFMLMNTGRHIVHSQHELLSTLAWQQHQQTVFALEGSVFMAGAIVQWLRDGLGIINQSHEIENLAASVVNNGGVTMVPAFTGLGAPYWQAEARAAILGMSRGSSKAHIARAALESIAFQVADVFEAMGEDAPAPLRELRVDGGACSNNLLMQFQADLLGVPVLRPKLTEITALGAAKMAGLAAGLLQPCDLTGLWQLDRAFEPGISVDERMDKLNHWRRAVNQVCTNI